MAQEQSTALVFENRFPEEFSSTQGQNNWCYQYFLEGSYEDMVWFEDYLGIPGNNVWAHPDPEAQPGCYIASEGQMCTAKGHAEPVLVWISPYPDGTKVHLSGTVTGVRVLAGTSIPSIQHNDRWLWNPGIVRPYSTAPHELEITVDKGDLIYFHLWAGHNYAAAVSALDWALENRRDDYDDYEESMRIWNCSVTRVAEKSVGNTEYCIDSRHGDDNNNGTSPDTPWKTLDKVNSVTFAEGDRILLKAGGVWSGQLSPRGSGKSGNPIVIDMYGSGDKPIINGGGKVQNAVYLFNQDNWEIRNLQVTNHNARGVRTFRSAIRVQGIDCGVLSHIHVKNCVAHDVNGHLTDPPVPDIQSMKPHGGIVFEIGGSELPSRFNDVLIKDCHLYTVDRVGIFICSSRARLLRSTGHWDGHTNVVLRNCFVEGPGADGIIVQNCESPLVEHCVVKDANIRQRTDLLGMSSGHCRNALFQFNEVYLTRTRNSSEGFSADRTNEGTIFQYNYSHDNEGGFILLDGRGSVHHLVANTIIRYNISQNDQANVFCVQGPVKNTRIYNNTVYIGPGLSTKVVSHYDDGGYPTDTYYYNNIFYNLGSGGFDLRKSKNNVFENNVYFGNHAEGEPDDPQKLTSDPRLLNPGSGGVGRDTVNGYKLQADSPCIGFGKIIPDNGGHDYWGNKVPSDRSPDRGAHQYSEG